MTIRFSCSQCESVLKIRDELTGTKAKCPKCKTPFVIPAAPAAPEPESSLDDLVDMPREVTPPVQFDTDDGFDPADVLSSGSSAAMPAVAQAPADGSPRPSVAELMREHEAKMANKKKSRDRKSKASGLEEASGAAAMMTAGTATDALNRTYDQKRGKTSEPAPLTREERREFEQKEAMKQFAIKGGAGLAVVVICGYFLLNWALSESIPDLAYVSGVVTLEGQPMTDVEVMFAPISGPEGATLENATPSSAFTDSAGEYVMMYNQDNEGVIPGVHEVSIMNTTGIQYILPSEDQKQTVEVGESYTINFNL